MNYKVIKEYILFYMTIPFFTGTILILSAILSKSVMAKEFVSEAIPETSNIIYDREIEPVDTLYEINSIPEGGIPIVKRAIIKSEKIINETKFDISDLPDVKMPQKTDGPLVLIIHTHGSECYYDGAEFDGMSDCVGYYFKSTKTRTSDKAKSVVAVGGEFADTLTESGIGVIHCETMFDINDYNSAYSSSAKAIKEYLDTYPSIKIVIDIHRDSLIFEDGTKVRTSIDIDGKSVAQIMIVAGTNGGGSEFDRWKHNLAFDMVYKNALDEEYENLSRPILLRKARYNQHFTDYSFLIEIGTCANNLEEAKSAARLSAATLSKIISG